MSNVDDRIPEREPDQAQIIGISETPDVQNGGIDEFEVGGLGKVQRNLGKVILGTTAFVAVAAVGIARFDGCGSDNTKPKTGPAKTQPNQTTQPTFSEILMNSQTRPTDRPRVLTNFNLSTLIKKDYPAGTNTAESITFVADGCMVTRKKGINKPIKSTNVVFRNGETASSFSLAYLTPEHVEKAEDLRTLNLKLIKEDAQLKAQLSPLSETRKQQLISAITHLYCPGNSVTLKNPQLTSRYTIIEPQAFDENKTVFHFDSIDKTRLFLYGLLGLALFGLVGYVKTIYEKHKK